MTDHSEPDPTDAPTFGRVTRDPDLDAGPVPTTTILDVLRADLAEEVETPDVTLEVPGRPGYAVRYGTTITYDELQAWRKRAKAANLPGGVDELKLACIILANRCHAIVRNGEDVVVDGEPLTFASPTLHELVDASRAVEAVQKFYGRDPHVTRTAGTVLAEAGYTDDVAEAGDDMDPTTRS